MKATTLPARTRTWTFQPPAWSGLGPATETCLTFCRSDHTSDVQERTHPEDLWHQQFGPMLRMRLSQTDGEDSILNLPVMEVQLTQRRHSPNPAEQVPHVAIAVCEDQWTPALDPDALTEVIDTMAAFVDNLRIVHSQLVKALAEHQDGGQ